MNMSDWIKTAKSTIIMTDMITVTNESKIDQFFQFSLIILNDPELFLEFLKD